MHNGGMISADAVPTMGVVVAFFAGYSVRFSVALLERLLAALLPENKPGR